MNAFFTNLLDRHLGTCDTIQPRTPGRFEMDNDQRVAVSPDQGTNPALSEDTQNAFFVEAPEVTRQKSDLTGSRKDYSSPSTVKKSDRDPSIQQSVTERQTSLPDSHVLSEKPQGLRSLHDNKHFDWEALEQRQPNKAVRVTDDYSLFENNKGDVDGEHGLTRDKNALPASRSGEQYLENELSQRIRAMLQRLADVRGSDKNESPASASPEKKAPLLDAAVTALETTPAANRQRPPREENKYSRDTGNIHRDSQHRQLEAPSWLPDIEARFSQLQQAEVKAEPVINVTIGRVEVRAVQSETAQQAKRQKKPVGVMSLDDYLLQRKHGKQV